MLLPEHEKHHKASPADVGLKETARIAVIRTTNQTGEQFQIEIPVYPDDSREQLNDRVGFFLSIVQDRMEDENKAVNELNQRAEKVRRTGEQLKRLTSEFEKQVKAVKKRASKGELEQADADAQVKKLEDEFNAAAQHLRDLLASEPTPAE